MSVNNCNHRYVVESGIHLCVQCGRSNRDQLVCRICTKNKGLFKKEEIIKYEISPIENHKWWNAGHYEKSIFSHPSCYKKEIKKAEKEKAKAEKKFEEGKIQINYNAINPDFAKRQVNFHDGLESAIEVEYKKKREVNVKLFFSHDDFPIFSRNYTERKEDNFVRFIIQVARKTNTKLISGGNYDFDDDFSKGYTLFVILKYGDEELFAKILELLRTKKFGCMPSNFSIHAHLNNDYPMESEAKQILSEITVELTNSLNSGVKSTK